MARSRNIKPGFFKNEKLVELPFSTRLLFAGLWTLADREGRLEDRPKRIKMEIFPADNVDVDKGLQELHSSGFILRYQSEGEKYIQILAFKTHQTPHYSEKPSVIKAYELQESKPDDDGKTPGVHRDNGRSSPVAQPPDSLIPDSLVLNPDSPNPDSLVRIPFGSAGASPTAETWRAYSAAYFARYQIEPVRNATVNSQLALFCKRLSQSEAPMVAAFYLTHNDPYYVKKRHPVGQLLKDVEGLRTQWATGVKATGLEARSAEQVDAAQAQLKRLTGNA